MINSNVPPPKPITDISARAASIGRIVDRLPPGHYTMSLVKPEFGPLTALITQQTGATVTIVREVEIKR